MQGTPKSVFPALFFGGKKIPELMKGLGKGVKSFKDGMKEGDVDVNVDDNEKK